MEKWIYRIIIAVLVFILLISWSSYYWNKNTPKKTPEEQIKELYFSCVQINTVNHWNINDCNSIR